MLQMIAVLATAVALLTGEHTVRAMDASLPIGLAKPAPPASPASASGRPTIPSPMDATPPIGM